MIQYDSITGEMNAFNCIGDSFHQLVAGVSSSHGHSCQIFKGYNCRTIRTTMFVGYVVDLSLPIQNLGSGILQSYGCLTLFYPYLPAKNHDMLQEYWRCLELVPLFVRLILFDTPSDTYTVNCPSLFGFRWGLDHRSETWRRGENTEQISRFQGSLWDFGIGMVPPQASCLQLHSLRILEVFGY